MANLLKWGKDRLKDVNAVQHQINPFDGGRTFDTTQRGVAPGSSRGDGGNPDNQRGFQFTNNSLTRGLSRGYDQVNIADDGRSWKTRTPTQTAPVISQVKPAAEMVVGAPVKFMNTAAASLAEIPATVGGQFATHEYSAATKEYTDAVKSKDPRKIFAAKQRLDGAVNRVDDYNRQQDAAHEMFNEDSGGLFNMGTAYGAEDSRRGDLKTGVTKIGGNTLMTAATVAPFAKGGSFATLVGSKPVLVKSAVLGAEGAGYGASYSAGQQLHDNGKIDPKQLVRDAAFGAAGGAALPIAGAAVRNAPKLITEVAPKVGQIADDAKRAVTPKFAGLTKKEMVTNLRDLHELQVARDAIQGNYDDVAAANIGNKALHRIKNNYGHDFITGSRADRVQRINQFLEQNGEAMGEYQGKLARDFDTQNAAMASGQGGYVKVPGGAKDPAPDLHPVQKEFVNDYAEMLQGMDNDAYGGAKVPDGEGGYKRTSSHSKFYRDYYAEHGKPPTKEAWFQEARAQIESGKAAYGASEEFAQLPKHTVAPANMPGAQESVDALDAAMAKSDDLLAENGSQTALTKAEKAVQANRAKGTPGEVLDPAEAQVPAKTGSPASPDSAFTPPEINKGKYNVPKKVQKELDVLAQDLKGDIQAKVGKKLSLDEIKQTADATHKVLSNPKTREATLQYSAQLLNLREELGSLISKRKAGTITPDETVRLGKVYTQVKMAAADAGRTLNAFKEVADPHEATVIDVMIDRITKTGAKLDDINAAIEKLGPNPSNKELTGFYRQFVKATKEDWLDKFRYTNMLSAPLTHIVNMTSNAQAVFGVAPVQKLVEGAVDATKSAITGADRTRYAGEAGSYLKGAAEAIPEAGKKFWSVMTGDELMGNPDFDSLRNIPLAQGGVKGAADTTLSFVPRLLEAGDQFFTTMAKAGEKSSLVKRGAKGVPVDLSDVAIENITNDAAKYRLFRQELGKAGQGHLLDAVDTIPKAVQEWRNSENPVVRYAAKFTFPFISTPTNLFKQGIEYGPTGFLTIPGSADKVAQAAKATMGTAVVASAAGLLASQDAITFSEPSDAKQRDAFRAEGKQPYSIKIGGKWFGYSKLHPAIAFNLATVAATKDALDKGSIDQSTADKFLQSASGVLGFFRDQSYMKSVGDFSSILQAKDGASLGDIIANQTANTANQLMPFKSLTSWIGRQIDPTQRKVDYGASTPEQIFQSMVKDIPGLNKNVPTRKDPYTGEDLKNPHPILNSFSPVRVSDDKGFGNTTGLTVPQRMLQQTMGGADQKALFRRDVVEQKADAKLLTQEKNAIKEGKDPQSGKQVFKGQTAAKTSESNIKQTSDGKFYAKVGDEWKTFDNHQKAASAVAEQQFKESGDKTRTIGDTFYYKDKEGNVKSKSKAQYDYDQIDSKTNLQMDRAKASDDVDTWLGEAQKKYDAMSKLITTYDPDTEQDKINDLTKKMEDLRDQAEKYTEYGGFKKGSSGRSAKKRGVFNAPTSGGISLVSENAKGNKIIASSKAKITARKVS